MTQGDPESYEARAVRLARSTAGLGASTAFQARLLAALSHERHGRWSLVLPCARRVVPVLLLLALVTSLAASEAATETDEELAVAYGSAELEW